MTLTIDSSVTVGGAVAQAQNALGVNAGRRVAIIGDSQADFNVYKVGNNRFFSPNGLLSALQNRWGHRFYVNPELIKGVSGENSTQILARYNTDIAANYANFDWLIIQCGANDATQTVSAATTVANIITMAEAAAANGKRVIIIAPFPRSTWTGFTVSEAASRFTMLNQRKRLQDYVSSTQKKIILVDAFSDLVNPASSNSDPITSPISVMADGLHSSIGGMFSLAARRMSDVLEAHVPPRPYRFDGAAGVYDATRNPNGNLLINGAFLTGTGGTVTNVGGVAPSSWTAVKFSGSFTTGEVVASNLAAASGYDNVNGAKTRIAVNIASGKTSDEIVALTHSSSITTGFVAGVTTMSAACEVDLSNVARMKEIGLYVIAYDGVPTQLYQWADGASRIASSNFLYPENQKWYLRVPDFIPPVGTTQLAFTIQAKFDASSAAASAYVDISSCELRAIQ